MDDKIEGKKLNKNSDFQAIKLEEEEKDDWKAPEDPDWKFGDRPSN